MDLYEEIKRVKSYQSSISEWKDVFDDYRRIESSNLNKKLYGETLTLTKGCGCVQDFMNVLMYWTKEKIETKIKVMNGKFKLKDGTVLQSFGCEILTTSSCTDEKAIRILKKNPLNIRHFGSYPENWEEICGAEKTILEDNEFEDFNTEELDSRKEELMKLDKSVLRIMADSIHEDKDVKKAHHNAGKENLVLYVLKHEEVA